VCSRRSTPLTSVRTWTRDAPSHPVSYAHAERASPGRIEAHRPVSVALR
jgi:hypothetical protein